MSNIKNWGLNMDSLYFSLQGKCSEEKGSRKSIGRNRKLLYLGGDLINDHREKKGAVKREVQPREEPEK